LGTTGKELPINKLSDLIRGVIAEAGYMEVLTWALVSSKENYDFINRENPGNEAVFLDKPKTKEFEIVRTNLISSLFKVLSASKGYALPVRIFEVGDISFISSTRDVGAKNERQLAAVYSGKTSGLERIHALVDRLMLVNRVRWYGDLSEDQKDLLKFTPSQEPKREKAKEKKYEEKEGPTRVPYVYHVEESDDPAFFPGRRAFIYINNEKVGTFGIVHPLVLKNFDIVHPTSALEINLEIFLGIQ